MSFSNTSKVLKLDFVLKRSRTELDLLLCLIMRPKIIKSNKEFLKENFFFSLYQEDALNIWLLLLTTFNLMLLAILSINLFLKVKEKKEDQRLTKGLQLLQNKISILEDLSDKTDEQVRKLVHVLDQKTNELRVCTAEADAQLAEVNEAFTKNSELYQMNLQLQQQTMKDPHKTKTQLYVNAAKLAYQGYTVEQIAQHIDLSPAEIQMIVKVNKDQLQFAEDQLPQWAQSQQALVSQKLQQQEISTKELSEFADALSAQASLQTPPKMPQTFAESSENPQRTVKPFEFKRI